MVGWSDRKAGRLDAAKPPAQGPIITDIYVAIGERKIKAKSKCRWSHSMEDGTAQSHALFCQSITIESGARRRKEILFKYLSVPLAFAMSAVSRLTLIVLFGV